MFPFLVYGIIYIVIKIGLLYEKIKKYRSLPDDYKLKKIVEFLKDQKSNKKILTENCAICLERFINITSKKNKLIDDDDDISILNCGHQFHKNCISKWMKWKKDCPLCRQKINPKYNKDEAKMVWGVQVEYRSDFRNINYNHLYSRNFYIPPSQSSSSSSSSYTNYSSNYNFGGGYNCGGGATGGWSILSLFEKTIIIN